jgi:hypothetical protein
MKLIAEGNLLLVHLSVIDVYHDEWCRINRGGYCNCDPDIKLRPPPERN